MAKMQDTITKYLKGGDHGHIRKRFHDKLRLDIGPKIAEFGLLARKSKKLEQTGDVSQATLVKALRELNLVREALRQEGQDETEMLKEIDELQSNLANEADDFNEALRQVRTDEDVPGGICDKLQREMLEMISDSGTLLDNRFRSLTRKQQTTEEQLTNLNEAYKKLQTERDDLQIRCTSLTDGLKAPFKSMSSELEALRAENQQLKTKNAQLLERSANAQTGAVRLEAMSEQDLLRHPQLQVLRERLMVSVQEQHADVMEQHIKTAEDAVRNEMTRKHQREVMRLARQGLDQYRTETQTKHIDDVMREIELAVQETEDRLNALHNEDLSSKLKDAAQQAQQQRDKDAQDASEARQELLNTLGVAQDAAETWEYRHKAYATVWWQFYQNIARALDMNPPEELHEDGKSDAFFAFCEQALHRLSEKGITIQPKMDTTMSRIPSYVLASRSKPAVRGQELHPGIPWLVKRPDIDEEEDEVVFPGRNALAYATMPRQRPQSKHSSVVRALVDTSALQKRPLSKGTAAIQSNPIRRRLDANTLQQVLGGDMLEAGNTIVVPGTPPRTTMPPRSTMYDDIMSIDFDEPEEVEEEEDDATLARPWMGPFDFNSNDPRDRPHMLSIDGALVDFVNLGDDELASVVYTQIMSMYIEGEAKPNSRHSTWLPSLSLDCYYSFVIGRRKTIWTTKYKRARKCRSCSASGMPCIVILANLGKVKVLPESEQDELDWSDARTWVARPDDDADERGGGTGGQPSRGSKSIPKVGGRAAAQMTAS